MFYVTLLYSGLNFMFFGGGFIIWPFWHDGAWPTWALPRDLATRWPDPSGALWGVVFS